MFFLLKASDKDSGNNSLVSYAPANTSNYLDIQVNSATGLVSIHKVPKINKYCTNATVQFGVIAEDAGQPPKSSRQNITINIMVSYHILESPFVKFNTNKKSH